MLKSLARHLNVHALPSFIVAGTQKGGTTSLYQYLTQHPSIVPAERKEVHYFDSHFGRGERWYRSHFPVARELARSGSITGEASPYYLFHPQAPKRIAALLPDVKIVVCLRNPVDRAISHYWHAFNTTGVETLPMSEAFDREEERIAEEMERMVEDESYDSSAVQHFSYLSRGLYAAQLARFLRYFAREQMLILRSEDFFADPAGSIDRLVESLGLEPFELQNATARNVGTYDEEASPLVRDRLSRYFEPYNQRLYELLELEDPWW